MNEPPRLDASTKVTVERTGGFAGLTRRWSVELGELFDDWRDAIGKCPWDQHEDFPHNAADRYQYRIQAGDRSVELPEQAVTGPWRELVERTQQAADRQGSPATPPVPRDDAGDRP